MPTPVRVRPIALPEPPALSAAPTQPQPTGAGVSTQTTSADALSGAPGCGCAGVVTIDRVTIVSRARLANGSVTTQNPLSQSLALNHDDPRPLASAFSARSGALGDWGEANVPDIPLRKDSFPNRTLATPCLLVRRGPATRGRSPRSVVDRVLCARGMRRCARAGHRQGLEPSLFPLVLFSHDHGTRCARRTGRTQRAAVVPIGEAVPGMARRGFARTSGNQSAQSAVLGTRGGAA